MLAYIPYYNI